MNMIYVDMFYGDVLVVDVLIKEEIEVDYEGNMGKIIVKMF